MRRSIPTAGLLALATGAYVSFVRPRILRWGATDEEVRAPFPGGDIVPGGKRGSTMAVTIDAPPSDVWPWLLQMGSDRAGFYSWDRLDNAGRPSAEEIRPEWQSVAIGQLIASTPDHKHWFEVAALVPESFLALRACFTRGARQYDSKAPRPSAFSDTLWAFQLQPLSGNRTRLVVTTYGAVSRMGAMTVLNYVFWEPAHWIMQTRQFTNLKRRAERGFAQREQAVAARPAVTHGNGKGPRVPATAR